MSEYIIEIPDEYFASYDTERDMYYPDERDSAMPITPIVRCRDCVHGIKADLSGNWYECMKPDGNGDYARWEVEPDGFCAWACRKGVGE